MTTPIFRRFQVYQAMSKEFQYVLITNYHPTIEAAKIFAADLGIRFPEQFTDLAIIESANPPSRISNSTMHWLRLATFLRGQEA